MLLSLVVMLLSLGGVYTNICSDEDNNRIYYYFYYNYLLSIPISSITFSWILLLLITKLTSSNYFNNYSLFDNNYFSYFISFLSFYLINFLIYLLFSSCCLLVSLNILYNFLSKLVWVFYTSNEFLLFP